MTSLGSYAFYDLDYVTAVELPESLTAIGSYAFYSCDTLQGIRIPEKVTALGEYCFYSCPSLLEVSIPVGMKTIGKAAFYYCSALPAIVIPEGIEKVNADAFTNCSNLTITYKGKVRDWVTKCSSVYKTACTDMIVTAWGTCGSNLRWILDDQGTMTIYGTGNMSDYNTTSSSSYKNGCTHPWGYKDSSIEKIVVEEGVTGLGKYAFYDLDYVTAVELPGSLITIGNYAFSGCGEILSVSIPSKVTQIGTYAFQSCGKLSKITFQGDPPTIASNAFSGVKAEAFYKYGPAWTYEYMGNYGGELTWRRDCEGNHDVVVDAGVAATCTQYGLTEGSHCDFCGMVLVKQEIIPATGHTEVVDAAKEADCEYSGLTEGSHCSVCGTTLIAQNQIPALGHSFSKWEEKKAPTCTDKGLQTRVCSTCGKIESNDLPALGHEYKEEEQAADCENAGFYTVTCSVCGDVQLSEVLPALGHAYDVEVLEATCESEGHTTYTCSRCDHSYVDNVVQALGHNWSDWEGKDATCTEDGLKTRHCSRCDKTEEDAQKATGHNYESSVVGPGCNSGGYTVHTCTNCGDSYTEGEVSATGHSWGNWVTDKDATCTENGSRSRACSACEQTETQPIEAMGHDYVEKRTEPTCTQDGSIVNRCSRCGDTDTEILAAPGHKETVDKNDADCEHPGHHIVTCSVCGETLKEEHTDALGHNWSEWDVTDATCTAKGSEVRECLRCGETEKKVLEALGHDYDTVTTPPTCEETGYNTNTCKRCGDSYRDLEKPALGHDWSNWSMDTDAGCTEPGIQIRTCENCKKVETSSLPALGHAFEETRTEPTCTEDGAIHRKCSRCGYALAPEVLSALGHAEAVLPRVEPTCVAEGLTEGLACERCEAILVAQEPIPATGIHSFENAVCRHCGVIGGYCGLSFSWIFDETTWTLTVSGYGTLDHNHEDCNFRDFRALTRNLVIGEGILEIGAGLCNNWTGLEEVRLPDSLTAIGPNAFEGCKALVRVNFPGNLEIIAPGAFWETALPGVTLPQGLKYLGEYAFADCDKLESVTFTGDLPQILDGGDDPDTNSDSPFDGTDTVLYYPLNNPTWIPEKMEEICKDCQWLCESCANGHTEVLLEGKLPTCALDGITEGSYCSVCLKTLVYQTVISALGHSYIHEDAGIFCQRCLEMLVLNFPQEYFLLSLGEDYPLKPVISPADLLDDIQWSLEAGSDNVITIDAYGTVHAEAKGTAYVVATLKTGGYTLSERFRVDVADEIRLRGVQASSEKLTVELYSEDYTTLDILLDLPQNHMTTYSARENGAVAIEDVWFTDKAVDELFDIVVVDDRHVQIVPTDYAIYNPKQVKGVGGSQSSIVVGGDIGESKHVKSSYKSTLTVQVAGRTYQTKELKLTVKKTNPKIKATVEPFNSFYSSQCRAIQFEGGKVTKVELNKSAKEVLPTWLTLSEDVLSLAMDAPQRSTTGKVSLLVYTEGWRIPAKVTLTVKNNYKVPALKLSQTSVTMSQDTSYSAGASLALMCKDKKASFAEMNVEGIAASHGFAVADFDPETGSFLLTAPEVITTSRIELQVSFRGTRQILRLPLSVKTSKPSVKLSATTVTLNPNACDTAILDVIVKPEDYRIREYSITLVDKYGNVLPENTAEAAYADGKLTVRLFENLPSGVSYKLYFTADSCKSAVVTLKTTEKTPDMSLKVKGDMDLTFPEKELQVTAAFKNFNNADVSAWSYVVEEKRGKEILNSDVSERFTFRQEGNDLFLSAAMPEALDPKNTYTLKLSLALADGTGLEETAKLKLKRTAVKLKLSSAKLTLNKYVGDSAWVDVTCTTKGYPFTQPLWTVTDKRGNPAEGALEIAWNEGKLLVSLGSEAYYGETYKVLLQADSFAPAATLTVSIPTQSKSQITSELKTGGTLDVVRDGSFVVVTPKYKNVTQGLERQEELIIYSSADHYTRPVTHLFDIRPQEDGSFHVYKAEDAAMDPTNKYKVRMITTFGETVTVYSKEAGLKVKMGSVKLTADMESPVLFSKDKHSRVEFTVESKDPLVNDVAFIDIKDSKYRNLFTIHEYGDGTYAISFADDTISKKQVGKTISLALNVWLEGNEGNKPNTTLTLKLTIAN